MKRNNKGFTLIELLTVIAILAIILLIAAPTILGVLDKARKNTFKNQVLLYVEALKTEVALSALESADMKLTLPNEGSSIMVNVEDIPMDTNPRYKGNIIIKNEGNNKYTYTLSCISSDDYQITQNILVSKLSTDKIEKASEDGSCSVTVYESYSIGDDVVLIDGTVWYVIENSDSTRDTVTLFASKNFKSDGSGWSEQTDETSDYAIAFDEANVRTPENGNTYCIEPENGCNIYAAHNDTVVTNGSVSGEVKDHSTIKKFIDGNVKPYINNSLTNAGGTNINSIRLITTDEICDIINESNSNNNCTFDNAFYMINGNKTLIEVFTNVPTWLYSTWYWTMTPHTSFSSSLYDVNPTSLLYIGSAYYYSSNGARPVIVTPKSNIK